MVSTSLAVTLALSLCWRASSTTVQLRGDWLEISVGSGTFPVTQFGAKGDGKTDDTDAVKQAFAAAKNANGGTVVFPAGKTYLTAAFQFESSNTVMHVPLGAKVLFDNNQELYQEKQDMIEAKGLSNIGITGAGIIDGQGKNWWKCRDTGCVRSNCKNKKECRPKQLHFSDCDHVLLMDVTFKDSPNHVLEMGSDYTEMSHVSVLNPPSESDNIPVNGTYGPSHNTDGVDVHGSPFYIHHCHFDTGDDNIAVHASHLLVEYTYFGHGHGASIGSCGNKTALENITFRYLEFHNTGAGAKIKTHAGATNAYVRNVIWENMVHYNVEQSIDIDMFYDHGKNTSTDFKISNITIRNLTMHGTKTDAGKTVSPGVFHCQESSPCHGIHLEEISALDSKVPFDCYNAYGDWDQTSPKPCLMKEQTPPTPPGPAQWSKHMGKNCYDGHGATNIDTDPVGKLTLADCEKRCDESAGCAGITIKWSLNGEPTDCWRRSNINIAECESGNGYDTWTRTSTASLSSQTPASMNIMSWHNDVEQEILVV